MSILHINNFHHIRGGSDKVYFNTAKVLDAMGNSSAFFSGQHHLNKRNPYESYFPQSVEAGSKNLSSLPRFLHNPIARDNIRALITNHGPFDLAHLHIYYGRLTASILKPLRDAGIPIIQTLHEYKLACPVYTMERAGQTCDACVSGSTLNLLRHRCKNGSLAHSAAMLAEFWSSRLQGDVRYIDRFICISDFQLRIMREADLPVEKMRRLHNFVDTNSISPVMIDEKEDYLLYFGRIEILKGLPTLIKAVKATGRKLRIAGSGTWDSELRRVIADCPWIEHLGFVSGDALRQLVAKARAVIVPSEWYEPFGLTVIEAKAAGTPVIGARIGGIPELIRDGVDGLLFEAGNVDSLAEALLKFDDLDAISMGRAAREDAELRFSPEMHVVELLKIYNEVV